ncbi:hypothetical protein M758_UG072100, partial [Ceratodon purpureus]
MNVCYIIHAGCKAVYYIPSNEGLWNTSRTGAIIDSCDAILSVYPAEAREAIGYGEKDIVILWMPASRAQEQRHVWPIIASAARLLLTRILALESRLFLNYCL